MKSHPQNRKAVVSLLQSKSFGRAIAILNQKGANSGPFLIPSTHYSYSVGTGSQPPDSAEA
jgi:hypothetical protein